MSDLPPWTTTISALDVVIYKGQNTVNSLALSGQVGRKITRHFKNLELAERFLNGIRYENDKGSFDVRTIEMTNH